MNQITGMAPSVNPGGYPVAGGDPRDVDAAMNMNTGMAPGSFGGSMIPTRNRTAPPRPNPSLVGGAPSPGVPAPTGGRAGGGVPNNPNFSLVQYDVPGSGGGQGGRNAPIYTAGNFGGPQNAGWGQRNEFPQRSALPQHC